MRHRRGRPQPEPDNERPDGTLVLDAGAALHIPKGMWHRISSAAGTLAFSVRVADATAFAACRDPGA